MKKKNNIINLGCRLNIYEGEVIKSLIQSNNISNYTIINSCSVTQEAEKKVNYEIRRSKKNFPKKKIVVTGGNGRFANVLKLHNKTLEIYYPGKKSLNILNINSIEKYLKKIKPKYLIHCAALSRPMSIHDKDILKSIDLNIIGTSNVTKACSDNNIKLIYFSTGYVY